MKVVISGGSGVGKTETLLELCRQGQLVVGETARTLLQKPEYKGFPNNGQQQRYKFQLELAQKQRYREQYMSGWIDYVFFDRSILDVLVFTKYLNVLGLFGEDKKLFRFPDYYKVFILEPLQKYAKDGVRWENEKERNVLHKRCIDMYKNAGYEPVMVKEASVEDRVNFILTNIKGG